MGITILLVDDHQIVRQGLVSLLKEEEGIAIVAEAENGIEAVQRAMELSPDLVMMDMSMPKMNGIEAIKRIKAANPDMHVLALSMHDERRFVLEALEAGSRGYLLKDCAVDELATAIRTVCRGEVYLSSRITNIIVDEYQMNHRNQPSKLKSLSERECQVLQLIAEGYNTKEIAFKLELSIKTIETHRTNIQKKLKLTNVADLTKLALREGMITLD
ncbi:oxygen regulatory protein NreC [Geobacter sp. OR-1]|uniref:response regulator transcription factor n=1 Tax=Geobacter sp. OR-1 TaxID=1266765 RepID=UPI000543D83E|nr:response regulator transcription factor [Geobacter sp. OR-1]GAM11844.1 oxygen regulatory protein NreC [Geobacter sp. OR-1]